MERRGWIVKVTNEEWEWLKKDIEMEKSDNAYTGLSDFFDCYGNFMKGALCVDIVYRDVDVNEWILCGDGYILGDETGYGYTLKDNIPYDEADGFTFTFYPDKTYEEMMDSMIDQIEAEIVKNKRWKEASERTDIVWREDM